MYADEDTFPLTREDKYPCPEEFPYMQIYGEEVADYVRLRTPAKDENRYNYFTSILKSFLVLRFFGIMSGFHEGSLDLTGRHEPRYKKHADLWSRYLDTYRECWETQRMCSTANEDADNIEPTPYVDKHALWLRFCKIWKIPPQRFDFEHIEYYTYKTLKILWKNPEPKFQRLCLTDLPDEILEVIFSHTSASVGRLFASTCRHLSTIGYRFCFRERRLVFSLPLTYGEDARAAIDRVHYLKELASSERSKLLSSAERLLSHTDGILFVDELIIANCWAYPYPSFEEIDPNLVAFLPEITSYELFEPIDQAWSSALQGCQNLTFLVLHGIVLHLPILQGICTLAHLQVLELFNCKISEDLASLIHSDNLLLSTRAVRTLSMTNQHEAGDTDWWFLLLLFTNLRDLSINSNIYLASIPPISIASRCRFWDTLERLQLSDFVPDEVNELASWFNTSPLKPRLKHFKLSYEFWIPDESFIHLLRSLNAPHLQILVLSGLKQGEEALFTSIAEIFPELRALSLDRRASNRQGRSRRGTDWPLQIGQYARWASLLRDLRYFGWNRNGEFYWSASSYPITRFENEFPEQFTWPDIQAYEWDQEDNDWPARTFAAYCPKLEYYSELERSLNCKIDRDPHGKVDMWVPKMQEINWLPTGSLDGRFERIDRGWDPRIPDVRT